MRRWCRRSRASRRETTDGRVDERGSRSDRGTTRVRINGHVWAQAPAHAAPPDEGTAWVVNALSNEWERERGPLMEGLQTEIMGQLSPRPVTPRRGYSDPPLPLTLLGGEGDEEALFQASDATSR